MYFHEINDKLQLFSAADDYKIRIWDLQKSRYSKQQWTDLSSYDSSIVYHRPLVGVANKVIEKWVYLNFVSSGVRQFWKDISVL